MYLLSEFENGSLYITRDLEIWQSQNERFVKIKGVLIRFFAQIKKFLYFPKSYSKNISTKEKKAKSIHFTEANVVIKKMNSIYVDKKRQINKYADYT